MNSASNRKSAVIVGAGPAGLTAAYELLNRSSIEPIVFESDCQVGGISKTINYRGNRMDLGGHRFFSKSDWVMEWWQNILPLEQPCASHGAPIHLSYQGSDRLFVGSSYVGDESDKRLLVRSRLSRILYRRRFFDYPLKLSPNTLRNLGPVYTAAVGASYIRARLSPRAPETSLEDFLINRFGDRLYRTFFKSYTEKVWGIPCSEISAEWGAQRIKGLSVSKAIMHAAMSPFRSQSGTSQKSSETSLIERFLYPKLGPGQMWEEVTARVLKGGGQVHLRTRVLAAHRHGSRVDAVDVLDESTGQVRQVRCDYLVSTMPIKDLIGFLQPEDAQVIEIATALPYRDFMTAGLLLRRMRMSDSKNQSNGMPPDNWIYVQDADVCLGRIQIFNNWSPALVADPGTIWVGLEYFCARGDARWSMSDSAFIEFASNELAKLGFIEREDVLDGTVVRVPNAYPGYFGSYSGIPRVRAYLDGLENVFAVGRNGMHRYNNQDHSMLAAKVAVDCIVDRTVEKTAIWTVNAEDEYHEEGANNHRPGSDQSSTMKYGS